jgi:hypothetical protein
MAAGDRCYLSCRSCGRPCNGTAPGRCTHRMDCCGVIRAHVPTGDGMWVRSGMEGGYLTGPSTTAPVTRREALSAEGPDPIMVTTPPGPSGEPHQRSHP